ncbi:hypothetical protein [Kitasatospora sp. NPDC002965]|uniref:hypothetical protein n=1 Tax=Kitasatospora sp. NPDC002965 TaxID=3154775 RepID=UPI0033AAC3D6
MSPRHPNRPSGPFPYLDEPEWRARFVQAGLADTRCTLDESALQRLATEVINIKPLITTTGRGSGMVGTGLKDQAVQKVETEYGVLYQLVAKQPGLAGAINQFNIRFSFDVAASSAVPTPKVTPAKAEGTEQPAVMEAEFDSEKAMQDHLTFVEGRLTAAETARKYDLKEDLAVSGQSERATYHLVRYRVGDQVWDTISATAGSNRTRHRHDLFGIQPAVGLLGLAQAALGGPEGLRWRSPADWRDRYTAQLNKHSELDPDDIEIPTDDLRAAEEAREAQRWARRAADARQVAVTDAAFVIGFVPKAAARPDFDAALASTNLRTHLRGPLDFTDTNQAMAAARKLVDQAYNDDAITDLQHAVLTGAAPAAELHENPREAVAELVRLVDRVVYPSEKRALRRTTKVLVEPSPSLLREKHAKTRGDIRSALLTVAVGGVALPSAAMDNPGRTAVPKGVITTGLSVDELIVAATGSASSLARTEARADLGHLAVPGLVNGKVFLGPYGSSGDRRSAAVKLGIAAQSEDGVLLFVEAIEAFARVIQLRAGREVVPQSAPDGRVRRVDGGEFDAEKTADSDWFWERWQELSGDDTPGVDSGTVSEASPSEQWADRLQKTQTVVDAARGAVTPLVGHFAAMEALVGPDREMSTAERYGWMEQLDDLGGDLKKAVEHVRNLRDRTTGATGNRGTADDFAYGTEGSR